MKSEITLLIILTCQLLNIEVYAGEEQRFIELSDISYHYEMIYDERGIADCNGTFELTINLPTEYSHVLFTKSIEHLKDSSKFGGIGARTAYLNQGPSIHVRLNNVSWGTYCRAAVLFTEGESLAAPDICVDDYMSPEDIAIIKGQAEINAVHTDNVVLRGKNGFIEIDAPNIICIQVYSIDGSLIYEGNLSGYHSMPVPNSLLIVKYTLNGISITKKISTL